MAMPESQSSDPTARSRRSRDAPAARRYSLSQLLVGVTPQAMRDAFDWGPDQGREIVD